MIKSTNMQVLKLLRVAAYARVSNGKDSMLHSLAAQISYYNELIQKRGNWEFAGVYADEAITGTKDNRSEFKRLVADCKSGKIDMVITKSISRFARNTVTLLETVRELKALSVDVCFEREKIHSISGEGELMLTILASFAQEESLSASENCKWRIQKRFEQGEPVGFVGMYGYDFKKGKIMINENQAAVIRQIFDRYIGGEGTSKIAKRLNTEKISAHQGGKWTDSRVNSLLRNEKLTGNSLLQKKFIVDHLTKKQKRNKGEKTQYFVENTHPAIINAEVFEKVNRIRQERAEYFNAKDTSKNRYPFTGKIICENCGKHYKRKKAANGFNWQCSTFLQQGKIFCGAKAIPEMTLENIVKEFKWENKIKKIIVPEANRLIFLLNDNLTVNVKWPDRSRKESWTPEMKEIARQQQIKIYKQRRQSEERHSCYGYTTNGQKDEQLTSYVAQVDYYTKHIKSNPEWEFVSVYTDEGITATNTKKRDGFNKMIDDALTNKIDLIITKSVSRFARNTVDSLITVRKLKEKGIEVYFEKENIWTLDAKGGLSNHIGIK
jgi:DNA invertase Pin-like site-specific DNA recombinase